MEIKIRRYNKNDKPGIICLVKNTLFEIFGSEAKNIEDLKRIDEEYFGKGGIFLVAEINGKIIGTIGVVKERSKIARLKRMYVHKKYRGKGVGQRLLNKAILFCKKRGYEKLVLSTYPKMKDAIEFYLSNGFEIRKKDKKGIHFEKELN